MIDYVAKGAEISACGRYRYLLWREWRGTHNPKHWEWWHEEDGSGQKIGIPKSVLFVMLNPSIADAEDADPTVKRCINFAKLWCYSSVEIVNLFAYIATDPKKLLNHDDPIG